MMLQKKGFTLIELLIVLIIIGVLATLAIPQYTGYVEKARAAEALSMIGALKTAEAAYKLESGVYTTDITQLQTSIGNVPTANADATGKGQYWYYAANSGGFLTTTGYGILATRSSKAGGTGLTIQFNWSDATGAFWSGTHSGVPKQ